MNSQRVLEMINELEVTDFYSEFGVCIKVYVRKNQKALDFLWNLEIDESSLDVTEASFEISCIALEYNFGFDGVIFYDGAKTV